MAKVKLRAAVGARKWSRLDECQSILNSPFMHVNAPGF